MPPLPDHGKISCQLCFDAPTSFDVSKTGTDTWRITNNPLAWGSKTPEILVLGFSKGPTQAGSLTNTPHNQIAYKGSRLNVGKILSRLKLIEQNTNENLGLYVDKLISNPNGRFHFASLVRCTVERLDKKTATWKGSGGGMLDKFVATSFGNRVAENCTTKFLSDLPDSVKLVVMFGLGTKLNYVSECYKLFQGACLGDWTKLNDVSYTNERLTVVHVEHFASQGALIPNWLGVNDHPRSSLSEMAMASVNSTLGI